MYDLHRDMLIGAEELVNGCRCDDGCPVCVGPTGPGGREVKQLTVQLIQAILD